MVILTDLASKFIKKKLLHREAYLLFVKLLCLSER